MDGQVRGRDLDEAVVVALGANLRTPGATCVEVLASALGALERYGIAVVAGSRVWRSTAWPDPAEPPYFNAVALVRTALDPQATLKALHAVEAAFGRVRSHVNAPRTLDLDLIAYGRRVMKGPPILPHPRAAQRLFVMGPLAEIAPGWRHPATGDTAAALAAAATVGLDAAPVAPTPPPQ